MRRLFTSDDQHAFAELSGDFNPMHVDPVAARRTLYGRAVVHGVHVLLWAMNEWAKARDSASGITALTASFSRPVAVGEEAACSLSEGPDEKVRIQIASGGTIAARVDFQWNHATRPSQPGVQGGFPEKRQPAPLSAREIEGRSGVLPLRVDLNAATQLFPNLSVVAPMSFMAFVLASTRLVGVECPGLHSVYSKLVVRCDDQMSQSGFAHWEVAHADARFGLVLMSLRGAGYDADVTAFVRPEPTTQAGYAELRGEVQPEEFSDQRALVVGGSRGIGEVTAKILCAGGADVCLSWHRGAEDAQHVVDDIRAGGGRAVALHMDMQRVSQGAALTLPDGWAPTHLYYFASPHIGAAPDGRFDPRQFEQFCAYYVTGFERLVAALHPKGLIRAFYPSSVYVEELPMNMGEYAVAKAAGEALCAFLERCHQGLRIHRPRLPRLSTDQTANILGRSALDPATAMLGELRKMTGLR